MPWSFWTYFGFLFAIIVNIAHPCLILFYSNNGGENGILGKIRFPCVYEFVAIIDILFMIFCWLYWYLVYGMDLCFVVGYSVGLILLACLVFCLLTVWLIKYWLLLSLILLFEPILWKSCSEGLDIELCLCPIDYWLSKDKFPCQKFFL